MPISPLEVMRNSIVCFEGKAFIVEGVRELILLKGRSEWIGGSMMNGEPISELWLQRLGFEWDQHTWSKGQFWLAPDNDSYAVFLHGLSCGVSRRIQYLHQLQGLYFFFTGEYLQIPKIK